MLSKNSEDFGRGYKKSSYRAEELVKDIDNAINNEKKFCEDIVELENTVSSNIGKLIQAQGITTVKG